MVTGLELFLRWDSGNSTGDPGWRVICSQICENKAFLAIPPYNLHTILLMEGILHHPAPVDRYLTYLQVFLDPRWCRISSINSTMNCWFCLSCFVWIFNDFCPQCIFSSCKIDLARVFGLRYNFFWSSSFQCIHATR